MTKAYTIEDINRRLYKLYGGQISIKEETYNGYKNVSTFIDKDHGEYTAVAASVLSGLNKRNKLQFHASLRYDLQKVKELLAIKHKGKISIIDQTYIGYYKKAVFVDPNYGKWSARVHNVVYIGTSHPKRGLKNRRKTTKQRYGTEISWQSPVIKKKIAKKNLELYGAENPGGLEIFQEKGRKTCQKKYGVNHPLQNKEIFSKVQKSRRDSCVLKHWKTNEELVCVGSYEKAFVEWCNDNQIDFDWQIRHDMPDGKKYIIDAFIKDGKFANTWIEIKGFFRKENDISKMKWEWFHLVHPNDSQIWFKKELIERGIL